MRGLRLGDISEMVHGTTLVTNAVIERKGARLGLITTRGFRDMLEMGTEQRYDIYDLFLQFPDPLVPRDRRIEVHGTDGRAGPRPDPARRGGGARGGSGAGGRRVRGDRRLLPARLRQPRRTNAARPKSCAPGFPSWRCRCRPRWSPKSANTSACVTTCANAYVQPLMDRYLHRLERELRARGFCGDAAADAFGRRARVARGGARAADPPAGKSARPAAGWRRRCSAERPGGTDVISFDMGGTTAKACLIEDGRAEIAPMMEAARVHRFTKGLRPADQGAGHRHDRDRRRRRLDRRASTRSGLLKVGPHSRRRPIPAPPATAWAAQKATVTDANLRARLLRPGLLPRRADGAGPDAARARRSARLGSALGLAIEEAALGIHKVVVRERWPPPRACIWSRRARTRATTRWSRFGGAGPAHAVDVARVLGITRGA